MDKETKEELLANLHNYFRRQGISQADIANKLGISAATVSCLLSGKSNFGKTSAANWHDAFGIRESYLMSGEGPMFDESEMPADKVTDAEASTIVGGTTDAPYSIDRILEIMDRNSRTMLSQQETIAELMNELKKRM